MNPEPVNAYKKIDPSCVRGFFVGRYLPLTHNGKFPILRPAKRDFLSAGKEERSHASQDAMTKVRNPKKRRKSSGVPPGGEAWGGLRSAGLVRRVAPGEALFQEGDEAEGAYVLLSGRCAVSERGERVNVIEPGELFGEIGGFGGGIRTATVTALVSSEVLLLSPDQLQRGFADSPDLLRKTLQVLAGRTRRIADRQVAYREEHGPFEKPEDLAAVKGIGPRPVDKLKPYVTCGAPP